MTSPIKPANHKPFIRHIVVIGDSISDRGTLVKKEILGFIPMRLILAFTVHTNHGRFTNAYAWDDDFGAMMASAFLAQHLKKKHKKFLDDCDIADAIINRDEKLLRQIRESYSLDNDRAINYKAMNIVRTYCEGGLTAADYRHLWAPTIPLEGARLILKCLADMRAQLEEDDSRNKISKREKSETVVLELTGGNDLVTVNAKPTQEEAERAVKARMANLRRLISDGYTHFVLFLLPDLSMSPRFYQKTEAERADAASVVAYFNRRLQEEIAKVKTMRKDVDIDTFDVNGILKEAISHPEKFGFDPAKIHTPFINSKTYHDYKGGILSAPGYLFWDELHPSSHMHAIFASHFFDAFEEKYTFTPPDPAAYKGKHNIVLMYEQFMQAYENEERKKMKGVCRLFHRDRLSQALRKLPPLVADDAEQPDIEAYRKRVNLIFNIAFRPHGREVREVLKKLGWVDRENRVNRNFLNVYTPGQKQEETSCCI